jgi:hypothetical protein
MKFPTSESTRSDAALANGGLSGLSPEHKAALGRAKDLIAQGHSQDAAVDHLVANGMPRVVGKVLVKQLDKRS